MPDSGTMRMDPVFAEVIDVLYEGAVDPREAWDIVSKMSPDMADLHVKGSLKLVPKGKKKAKKDEESAKHEAMEKEIKKAFDDIVQARREGKISTELALKLSEDLSKGLFPGGKAGKMVRAQRTVQATLPTPKHSAKPRDGALWESAAVADGTLSREHRAQHMAQAVKTGRRWTLGLAAGGGAAAGAGGTVAYQKRKRPVTAPVAKYEFAGEISKVDADKRQVFGWCSLSSIDGEPVVDLQGDYAPLDEIEKAAYAYVTDSRKGGNMHAREGDDPRHVANLVESFVVTPEKLEKMGLAPDALPHGWWVGFKVDDEETWQQVKKGERTGFSIHGKGQRVEKMLHG